MDSHIIKLLRRYRVTLESTLSNTHGTASSDPAWTAAVTIENSARKLTGHAWGRNEEATIDNALMKVARQADALDELE